MKRGIIMIIICALSFCTQPAQAVSITIEITGNITYLNVGTSFNDIHVGDIFNGTYTYDTSTPDSDADPQWGEYQHNSPYGINLSLDGYEFKTDATQMSGQFSVSIADNWLINLDPIDRYSIDSYQNNTLSNGLQVSHIGWELVDFNHTVFSSDALPTTAPILNQWNRSFLDISVLGPHGGQYRIIGTVTEVVIIPEPLTGILMATGVLFFRRRKQVFVA
jgi:hypothetical protein